MAKAKKIDDPTKEPGINTIYKPVEKELEVRKMVYGRYYAMREAPERKKAESIWDRSQKQWEAERGEKGEWQSNHYVPLTTAIVETALAEMVDQNPRPLILPRSSEDASKATVMRHIYDYTWEVADSDAAVHDIMKGLLIFGTAIGQEYYWQDRRIIKDVVIGKDKKEEIVEKEALGYDDSILEPVRLQDFFVDEKARGFDGPDGARDCVRRYIMNIEDFRLFFSGETWNPLDNVKYVKAGGDINYYEFYQPPHGIDESKEVEVLWYWSVKPHDWLIIVANDVVIKYGPNPYNHKQIPFARAIDIKRPNSFYGKGEPELLESIQDEMNTLRRMILDRNHLDIDKMFLVSDTLQLNDEDLIARPHGAIPSGGDINAAKPIEYGDIPRSVELSLNALYEDAVNTTGIDPRQGSKPQPATATEAALLKEAALKKIRMKLRILEREFLIRVARLRVSNIIQFYAEPTIERIVGEKGSAEYKSEVERLKTEGSLVEVGGEQFQEVPRKIAIEGKRLEFDDKGQLQETSQPGYSFFDLDSKFFIPAAKGGFDIKFGAGPTLPVSKPLLQTKTQEMYDRLIQLALSGVGYDPVKLGDMLLKINDFDPQDFKQEEQAAIGGVSPEAQQNQEQLLELADQENELMMQGQKIDPTAYASPAHTTKHIEVMNGEEFQMLPNDSPVIQIMTTHVVGELTAEGARSMQQVQNQARGEETSGNIPSFQGQGQQNPPPQVGGNTNNPLKQMMPGMIQGGGDVPLQ